jgi:hypothetical protein
MLHLCCLQSRPNCNAILLTTEITTPAYYKGKDKHRQVTNMIFRTGASAVLFSNKRPMLRRAKYVLDTNYRVHLASRDPAYKCIWYGPDAEGNNGECGCPASINMCNMHVSYAAMASGFPAVISAYTCFAGLSLMCMYMVAVLGCCEQQPHPEATSICMSVQRFLVWQ